MKLSHGQAVALMVMVTLLWSIAGIVTRQLESARSFEITFWRSFFTLLSLLVILPLAMGRGLWQRLTSGGASLWVAGLCWSVMFTAFMLALTLTSVANVLVTMAVGPLLTAVAAHLLIGHRLALRTWCAIVVAGMGIGCMFWAGLAADAWSGMLVALCVPLAGAANWTVAQHAQRQGQGVDLVPAVLLGALLSSLFTLPLAWPFQATGHDLGLLALLGLVQLAIPCCLAVVCATVLKAPEVSLLALLEVVFGITLAWFGANEIPSAAVLAGGTLVISALVGNEWLAWRQSNGH